MGKLAWLMALAGLLGVAGAAMAAEPPKLTLEVSKCPATEVLAQLQAQVPGVQICAMPGMTAEISVAIQDQPLAEALGLVAQELKGSVLRGYIIERVGPGDNPYSGSEFLDYTKSAREEWRKRLTTEQRQALEEQVQAHLGRIGQTGVGLPRADVLSYDDPLLRYKVLPTRERITLQLAGQPLQSAVDAFMLASGYTVLVEETVEGAVTLEESDQELAPILDKLAAAGQAKWRMFYLVSQPVKVSDQDLDQRADQLFGEMWQGFWNESPEQRARLMDRVVQNLGAIPPERVALMKAMPFATKMFSRLMRATTQLTPDQRREFAPVMQAVGKIMAR